MSTATADALAGFSPHARRWFEGALGTPTPAQTQGWPPIAAGEHVLLCAPTGSGKTLAAFLWFLDQLMTEPGEGLRVLYVSPLKALNYDVERNLRAPLAGHPRDRGGRGLRAARAERRRAHRRHAARGAPSHAAHAARRAHHDAREPLPAAHLARARDAHRRRGRDRRRGARGRGDQARRAPRALARAPLGALRARPAARRAVCHAAPARGDRALRRRRPRRCASSTPACARSSTCGSRCRSRARPSTRRWPTCRAPTTGARTRSGRRSTPSCSSSCTRTTRRSCS